MTECSHKPSLSSNFLCRVLFEGGRDSTRTATSTILFTSSSDVVLHSWRRQEGAQHPQLAFLAPRFVHLSFFQPVLLNLLTCLPLPPPPTGLFHAGNLLLPRACTSRLTTGSVESDIEGKEWEASGQRTVPLSFALSRQESRASEM